MEKFTKKIAVGNVARLFEFTMIKNYQGVKFFITSKDADNKPFSFSLKQKDQGAWKLVPGSTRWLYEIESQLSDAIVETREP
jgi:hypothetical protein